ncbi:hypothetical protein CYMTET_3624 [Cymbomonas tetramitiformis]|uniref:Cilia- and flagella-associated protein 91 n=1 Tax=Cymbomonas tetramitiformis TaxID=36881 RepID=A0AAE0LKV7_9CHLO|nr:hypothetical protein CYMTET_3624 [Cymbomonas tetramitiformis]
MQEHRSFDALYDTTYTVSGPRDHYREQSRAAGFLLERCPEFKNFYSELPTHPSQTFRFKANDKLPRFVSRDFDPSHHSNSYAECVEKSDAANITGHHRYKYFRRPLLPGGPVALAPPEPPPPAPPAELPPGTKVTTATQSDYRETESQTIPYAPDYVIAEPTAKQAHLSEKYHMQDGLPEVLTLQHLTYTNGLPPGLAEVEMVEKQRQKRKFEANLPPLNDLNQLPLRQKLMEDWENKEWADREEEIKGLQDERLEVLQRAIAVREMRAEARTAERIEAMKATKLKEKQKTFAVIQSRRIKALRKLANARKLIEAPKESIIDEYHNYSSKVYAPQTRQGQFADLKPRGDVDPKPFEPANYKVKPGIAPPPLCYRAKPSFVAKLHRRFC